MRVKDSEAELAKKRMSHPRNIILDKTEINQLIRDGRGPRADGSYCPWILTPGVSRSTGAKRNWRGIITKRDHHVLSNWEYYIGNIFDFSLGVKDICEQYPLLPIDETLKIAESLGVVHPYRKNKNKQPKYIVMTTDFVLKVETKEGIVYVARSVKQHDELTKNDWIIEKLEIERRYWAERNIDWGLITDLDYNHTLAENIDNFLRPHKTLEGRLDYSAEEFKLVIEDFTKTIIEWNGSVSEFLRMFEEKHHMGKGKSVSIFWHLLANRHIITDLTQPLDLSKKIALQIP